MHIEELETVLISKLGETQAYSRLDSQMVKGVNERLNKVLEKTKELGKPAKIPPTDLYKLTLRFFIQESLTEYEIGCLAAAINIPVKEERNRRIVETEHLTRLLDIYRRQLKENDLLIGTWWRLFQSYFNIEMDVSSTIPDNHKKQLSQFLSETYNKVNQSDTYAPDWLVTLHEHSNILTADPCSRYANKVLNGDMSEVSEMSSKVNIPDQSWFWHRLMKNVIDAACNDNRSDKSFKKSIPTLLDYIEKYNGYRDLAIKAILERYYKCQNRERHDQLCRYIIKGAIWGSPEFKQSNLASRWHKIDEPLYRMVLSWVNKEKLRLFFEKLTERYETDKSRFEFWSKYERQICDEGMVILVIGRETKLRARRDADLKKVIGESGTFAYLDSAPQELDAIIMQIRDKVIVDFTVTNNAGYIYSIDNLPFSLSARRYSGGTGANELKAGFNRRPPSPRITRGNDWQQKAKRILIQEGIFPDR